MPNQCAPDRWFNCETSISPNAKHRLALMQLGKDAFGELATDSGNACQVVDANESGAVQSLLGEYLGCNRDLALAAIDDEQIGCGILSRDNARDATRERLAQCGVVITPRGGLDVEAPVFVALHARMIEDHT